MGRPVADSPKYEGPLYFIEIPNPNNPKNWILHKLSMREDEHEEHLNKMLSEGVGIYRAYSSQDEHVL